MAKKSKVYMARLECVSRDVNGRMEKVWFRLMDEVPPCGVSVLPIECRYRDEGPDFPKLGGFYALRLGDGGVMEFRLKG